MWENGSSALWFAWRAIMPRVYVQLDGYFNAIGSKVKTEEFCDFISKLLNVLDVDSILANKMQKKTARKIPELS